MGLIGVTPLAALGPVGVGPSQSGLEHSSLKAEQVTVFVDALQSLLQRKAVLRLLVVAPQVCAERSCPHITVSLRRLLRNKYVCRDGDAAQ